MNDQSTSISPDRSSRSARFYSYVHRYRNLLRKRWWVLPLAMIVALAIQSYRVWNAPPSFISLSQMIVNIRLSLGTGSLATYTEELSNFMGTQQLLMQCDEVIERAHKRVRELRPELVPIPVAVNIVVSPKTTVFNLKATGAESRYTQSFLDAAMHEYLNKKKEMREETSGKTLASIREELVRLEKDLQRGDEELLNFQSSNSVPALEQTAAGVVNYLVTLNSRLEELKTEFQLLELLNLDQSLELQQKKQPAPTAALPSDTTDQADSSTSLLNAGADYLGVKKAIQLKKAEQKELSEYLRPKHPKIVALTEQISRYEKLLAIFREQSQEQLGNKRESLKLQIQNLESQIKEQQDKSRDISRKMAVYQRIKGNNERNKSLYERLLGTVQSLAASVGVEPESVIVLKKASSALPNRLNLARTLIVGALLGLALGVALLLIIDRFDDRPTSFTELQESFDEPVLGQIPQESPADRKAGVSLIQVDDERHAFVEAYRNLRSSLLYMATEGKRPKTILVTSAIPGDGKSMTAANTAITMAQSGSRVLLVDADLRKGVLHKHFSVQTGPGLTEVLSQGADWAKLVVPAPAIPNLFILPRGAVSKNPGEMFLNQITPRFLQEIGSRYDYVVMDTAPVMAADDVTSLAPNVEGVIFVIRAGYTSSRVARAALDLLYQREVDVLGLVFNGVESQAAEYYFYKYKDYYAVYPSA